MPAAILLVEIITDTAKYEGIVIKCHFRFMSILVNGSRKDWGINLCSIFPSWVIVGTGLLLPMSVDTAVTNGITRIPIPLNHNAALIPAPINREIKPDLEICP